MDTQTKLSIESSLKSGASLHHFKKPLLKVAAKVRDHVIKFRASEDEVKAINDRALAAGVTVSRYLREVGMGNEIRISRSMVAAPSPVAFELRKIGAMLKSMYPKEGSWTHQEKRDWWNTMSLLVGIAQRIDTERGGGAGQGHQAQP